MDVACDRPCHVQCLILGTTEMYYSTCISTHGCGARAGEAEGPSVGCGCARAHVSCIAGHAMHCTPVTSAPQGKIQCTSQHGAGPAGAAVPCCLRVGRNMRGGKISAKNRSFRPSHPRLPRRVPRRKTRDINDLVSFILYFSTVLCARAWWAVLDIPEA